MKHSEDNCGTRDTLNRPIPGESSWDFSDPNASKRLSYYEPSEDCLPYLSGHDSYANNYSFPQYLNHSFDYRLHNGVPYNQDASVDVASAPTTIAYGWPVVVQRPYDDNYPPNRQPYYHPQQSQAIQHQHQATDAATQRTVNSDAAEDSCSLDCSICGAVVLSIFSLLFCCICGIAALTMAMAGHRSAGAGDMEKAKDWRNASYGLSIFGLIFGGIITAIYIYLSTASK